MKRAMLTSVILLASISGEALAACSEPYLGNGPLNTLLAGNTVCSPAYCSGAGCQWQEQHRGGSQLWDFKNGGSSTSKVGEWAIRGNEITYLYGPGGGPYPYRVKDNGNGTYSFCGSNGEFTFTRKLGQTGC